MVQCDKPLCTEMNVSVGSSIVKFVYRSREDEDEATSGVCKLFFCILDVQAAVINSNA